MPEPSEWLAAAAAVIDRVTDRWAEAGALAAMRYRLAPRVTTDADILVAWSPDLIPALRAAGYQVDVKDEPGADHPFLLFLKRGDERVDVIISEVPFQDEALDRAVDHILTVEDVLIFKLLAWRNRDRDDVASILASGHRLDHRYIERWAAEWEIEDRWLQAFGPRDG